MRASVRPDPTRPPGIILLHFFRPPGKGNNHTTHLFPNTMVPRPARRARVDQPLVEIQHRHTNPGIIIGNIINGLARKVEQEASNREAESEADSRTPRRGKARSAQSGPPGTPARTMGGSRQDDGGKRDLFIQGCPSDVSSVGKRRDYDPMRSLRDAAQGGFLPSIQFCALSSRSFLKASVKDSAFGLQGRRGGSRWLMSLDPNVPRARAGPVRLPAGSTLDYDKGSCICKVAEVRMDTEKGARTSTGGRPRGHPGIRG